MRHVLGGDTNAMRLGALCMAAVAAVDRYETHGDVAWHCAGLTVRGCGSSLLSSRPARPTTAARPATSTCPMMHCAGPSARLGLGVAVPSRLSLLRSYCIMPTRANRYVNS